MCVCLYYYIPWCISTPGYNIICRREMSCMLCCVLSFRLQSSCTYQSTTYPSQSPVIHHIRPGVPHSAWRLAIQRGRPSDLAHTSLKSRPLSLSQALPCAQQLPPGPFSGPTFRRKIPSWAISVQHGLLLSSVHAHVLVQPSSFQPLLSIFCFDTPTTRHLPQPSLWTLLPPRFLQWAAVLPSEVRTPINASATQVWLAIASFSFWSIIPQIKLQLRSGSSLYSCV